MKRRMFVSCAVLIIFGVLSGVFGQKSEEASEATLRIGYSAEFQSLATEIGDAYLLKHAELTMEEISLGSAVEGISIVGKEGLKSFDPEQTRKAVIARKVFVPIANRSNPLLAELNKEGMSPADFALAYACEGDQCWGKILATSHQIPVHAYRVNDPDFVSYLSGFLSTDLLEIMGRVESSCAEVFDRVTTDRNAIGFCTLAQLQQMQAEGRDMNVALIPVDMNDNGNIDHFEEIYGSVDDLVRGVWIGKYSASLYTRIFAVMPKDMSEAELEFVNWLAVEGQEQILADGYSGINQQEKDGLMASVNGVSVAAIEDEGVTRSGAILALVCLLGLGWVLAMIVFRRMNLRVTEGEALPLEVKITNPYEGPMGYKYDRSHTWSYVEKDGAIRVGVDSFIQYLTGAISKITMKAEGALVKKGEVILSLVQDGKSLDLKSPVTGKIRVRNSALLKKASLVNSSPYDAAWFYEIEPEDWQGEQSEMMSGETYLDFVKKEFERFKDFVAGNLQAVAGVVPTFQEGGEVEEGAMKGFGPESWEEFQREFLRVK